MLGFAISLQEVHPSSLKAFPAKSKASALANNTT
jgi:hypothetical protein